MKPTTSFTFPTPKAYADSPGKRNRPQRLAGTLTALIACCGLCLSTNVATGHAYAGETEPQPLMQFNFDNTLEDQSGNGHNGIAKQNAEYVDGISGKALRIHNSNDSSSSPATQYLRFTDGDDIHLGTDDFAVSLWYKTAKGDNNGASIFGNKDYGSGSNDGFVLGSFADTVRVNMAADGTRVEPGRISGAIDGQWHHYVADYQRNGKLSVYMDGKLKTSSDLSPLNGKSADAGALTLGADSNGAYGLADSAIDNLTLYKGLVSPDGAARQYISAIVAYDRTANTARLADAKASGIISQTQADEIQQAIDDENALAASSDVDAVNTARQAVNDLFSKISSTELYMPFDGDYSDSGTNHCTGSPTGSPQFVPGINAKAIHLHNTKGSTSSQADQSVALPSCNSTRLGKNDFSVSLWYRSSNGDNNGAAIIGNKNYNSGTNKGFVIGAFAKDIRVNLADGSTRVESSRIGGVIDGQWHHIAANFARAGSLDVYVDGTLRSSKSLQALKDVSADAGNLVIGADSNNANSVNDADIDEVRLTHHTLTADEISQQYLPGKLLNETAQAQALMAAHPEASDAKREQMQKLIAAAQSPQHDNAVLQRRLRDLQLAEENYLDPTPPADFTFDVISDPHISDAASLANLRTALGDMNVLNPDSQALVSAGDNGDSGSEQQEKDFYKAVDDEHGSKVPILALGNHDVRWQGSVSNPLHGLQDPTTAPGGTTPVFDRYLKNNGKYMINSQTGFDAASQHQLYFDQWVKGYHFLVINTEKDLKDQAYISQKQLNWVEKTMAIDAKANKPIFLVAHQTFSGTADHLLEDDLGGSENGVNEAKLKQILSKYPQAVFFTGHVHNGQDLVDTYNTPFGHIVDMPSFANTDYGSELVDGNAYEVSVSGSHVHIRMRNYITNQWVNEGKYDFDLGDTDPSYRVKAISPSGYIATAGSHDDAYDPGNRNGRLEYIDDGERQSNWKSQDLDDVSQAWVDFAFSKPTKISGVTYLPYLGGYFETGPHTGWYDTSEGTMLGYRIEVSHDNGTTYQTAATGTLKTGMKESWMPIPTQTVSNVRVVPLSTYGTTVTRSAKGYVAAAEMHPAVMAQGSVTLKYQDKQGNQLKADENKTGDVGTPYSFAAPAIDGYSCAQRFDGTYTDDDQTLIFVYSPNTDKAALRDAVQQAQAIDLSPYTPASTDLFRSALASAEKVLNNSGATQQEVQQAADSLQKAVAGLIVKGDKTRLSALIEQARKLDGSRYTPQSFAVLRQALQDAIAVFNDVNADQAATDNAARKLSDAQQRLERLPIQKPSLPAKPSLPGATTGGNTPLVNGSRPNGTANSTTTDKTRHGLASTGAPIVMPLLTGMILLVLGTALAMLERKRQR